MKKLILTIFGSIFIAFMEEQIFGDLYSVISKVEPPISSSLSEASMCRERLPRACCVRSLALAHVRSSRPHV